ncbi:extracellular solute-binding protein [Paenibacillus antri]|uniref:Extracellular solute-binding protein n=1 Tax=Paenibacillus antri TaxID=2582848 RepID=A0A5R9GCU3_9BACL|nr:extracellular solute-binding protein [Paenibacillus antri]TLS54297.1 extracellular solute-binding protein [Paenibacillus antri]
MAFLLCVIFLTSLLAVACSSGDATAPKTGEPTSGGSTAAPGAAEAEPAREEVTVRWMRGENPAQAIMTDTPVLKEIQKRTGVTIELEPVPGSNYSDKKSALLSTNNIPDIMGVEASEVVRYANTGMFVAVSDYLDSMPNFKKVIEENPEIKKLYVDGKLYSFPITESYKIQGGKALLIRTDVLEELGLNTPTTFDELYDALKAMKAAYPESYPFSARGMSFMDAFSLGMGSGYGITYDDEENRYFYGQNKPEFKDVLTYLNKLYAEKILDPDFAINTKQNWDEKLSTGKSLFYYDNNSFAVNYNKALQEVDPDAKFDLIPYLRNAKGETKGWLYPKGWLVDNYVVSSKTKNPEALMRMFDWMYGPEGTLATNYGVEGETYEIAGGKPAIMQSVIDKYSASGDPVRTMMSEIGLGLLALSVRVDEGPMVQGSSPDLVRWGDELAADPGAYYAPSLAPVFTEDETERLKDISSKLSILTEDVVKFIIGTKPLSDFDAWAKQLTDAGADEMEAIYNEALQRAS